MIPQGSTTQTAVVPYAPSVTIQPASGVSGASVSVLSPVAYLPSNFPSPPSGYGVSVIVPGSTTLVIAPTPTESPSGTTGAAAGSSVLGGQGPAASAGSGSGGNSPGASPSPSPAIYTGEASNLTLASSTLALGLLIAVLFF